MKLENFSTAFKCDSFLKRDIWIMKTTLDDWRCVFDFLKSTYPLQYVINGKTAPLPENIEAAFKRDFDIGFGYRCLYINVSSVTLTISFTSEVVIAFDLDQCQIQTDEQLQPLLAFIESIAHLINKEILCSEELYPYVIYFRFNPSSGQYLISH